MNLNTTHNHESFYFLRHGQTDHNLYKIYDDFTDVELNQTGINQAICAFEILKDIKIKTVCSSPLKRVQQTKTHALANSGYQDIIIDELKECSGSLWKLFLEKNTRLHNSSEKQLIQSFFERVEIGLQKALIYDGPILIIAHGGTYLALTEILAAKGENNINNCELARFSYHKTNGWNVQKVMGSNHV